jgi:F-type H+/Na+-transporting ATPase subunit alpha
MTETLPDAAKDWLSRSRKAVADTKLAPEAETVGVVERVADGIALVSGLPDVRLNELLRFDGGRLGFALTLDADFISVVLLDDSEAIESGSRVTGTGKWSGSRSGQDCLAALSIPSAVRSTAMSP